MADTHDPDALRVDLTDYTVPSAAPTAPYPPSPVEAKYYYYGIHSKPHLIARSSANVWVEPGLEAYILPKELRPFSHNHPLQAVWDDISPTMMAYLDSKGMKWTSVDLVRIGQPDAFFPVIWIGVTPGSLSAQDGVEIVIHCRTLLTAHDIDDVHVEICESEVWRGPRDTRDQ